MSLETELVQEVKSIGGDFVYFVDISQLSPRQNQGYPNAILIVNPLSAAYIKRVANTLDYRKMIIENNQIEQDEFHQKETNTDKVADSIAKLLTEKGYSAHSQSEESILAAGLFDEENLVTLLPHKTIAGMAGLGWVGKHNLLITREFGSAISMCSVLTDAPLPTVHVDLPLNACGSCTVCQEICPTDAIKGNYWSKGVPRNEIVDVHTCTTCLKCLVHCPWTQTYMRKRAENRGESARV